MIGRFNMITATFLLLTSSFIPKCIAFTPPANNAVNSIAADRHRHHGCRRPVPLAAVTKRQTFLLDGAELSYYVHTLAAETRTANTNRNGLPNLAPRSPQKRNRVGAITFVSCFLEEDLVLDPNTNGGPPIIKAGTQIIGVEREASPSSSSLDTSAKATLGDSREIISVDEGGLRLYKDSIAILPSNQISPSDAISTAATSLLGVHCSSGNSSKDGKEKIVIVGGGEYATFLSRALVGLGKSVSLVSARPPWSLPSPSDIASSKSSSENLIDILTPSVGSMSLGFATAIGEFDTLIDTLGDEVGMGNARNLIDSDMIDNGRFMEQLKELHGCERYVSTLTRSQQYVLKDGLLFARGKVLRYQEEVEALENCASYQTLPPSVNFGATLQKLLDQNIIYSADRNENGVHDIKQNFVRGWSLSDLTELKTWPRDGPRRFGFPIVDLSVSSVALRRKATNRNEADRNGADVVQHKQVEEVPTNGLAAPVNSTDEEEGSEVHSNTNIMITTHKSNANANIKVTNPPSSKSPATTSNPHVTTIRSASELNTQIIEQKQNCILFLTASYCQKCKRMTPQFNRMARIASSEGSKAATPMTFDNNVLFAHVDISNGPRGKQLGKILDVDKVPSVVIFQKGDHIKLGGDDSGQMSSMVVDRNNLNRLEEVAEVLKRGERITNVETLLSFETVKK